LLPHDAGPLFAQSAFVAAVLPIDLLIFLAARQLHRRRVDNHNVIASVDERGIRRLVLALENARSPCGDPAQHLAVGVDEMPADALCGLSRVRGAGYERRHFPRIPSPIANLCVGGSSERNDLTIATRRPQSGLASSSARPCPTTTNPNDTNAYTECQAGRSYVR